MRWWHSCMFQAAPVMRWWATPERSGNMPKSREDHTHTTLTFTQPSSIHYLYLLNPVWGWGRGWSLSLLSSGERRGTPWTGRQSITGPHRNKRDKQPHTLTLTPRTILETPINLTRMFLDGGRKAECIHTWGEHLQMAKSQYHTHPHGYQAQGNGLMTF